MSNLDAYKYLLYQYQGLAQQQSGALSGFGSWTSIGMPIHNNASQPAVKPPDNQENLLLLVEEEL